MGYFEELIKRLYNGEKLTDAQMEMLIDAHLLTKEEEEDYYYWKYEAEGEVDLLCNPEKYGIRME